MTMMPLAAAILVSNRQLQEQTNAVIQNLPVRVAMESSETGDADELLDRIERHRPDVVLLEANRLALPLDELVQRLRHTPTQPVVFLLHTEANPQLILEALRAGVSEYLYLPLAETLRDAFERLSVARQKSSGESASSLGRIFGFMSARGGCGATTIVSHVAPLVARNLADANATLLADFDFESGMLRFIMKSRCTWSVRDALDNMHRMDTNYWKKLISPYDPRLDIIPAPDDLAARRPAGSEDTAHLMRFLRSTYRATIVDFGRHMSTSAFDSLVELDTLYLVVTTEPGCFEQTLDFRRVLERRGLPASRIKILLNRVNERSAPDIRAIESQLGFSVAATLPSDDEGLYDAWSEGRLLDSGSKLGREFNWLASNIVARVRGEVIQPRNQPEKSAGRAGKWFSFFGKAEKGARPQTAGPLSPSTETGALK
jgi:pilus assembly protein CpaE